MKWLFMRKSSLQSLICGDSNVGDSRGELYTLVPIPNMVTDSNPILISCRMLSMRETTARATASSVQLPTAAQLARVRMVKQEVGRSHDRPARMPSFAWR